MNKFIFATVTILSAFAASAAATVTGVKAQQRYPWNGKMDISYTASGVSSSAGALGRVPKLKVWAVERTTHVTNVAESAYLSGDLTMTDGTHTFTWDLDAQHAFKGVISTNFEVFVMAMAAEKPIGGMQLWENGPCWSECNLGANKPYEFGYYFYWGDTNLYKRNAYNNGWVSVKDGTSFAFDSSTLCPAATKTLTQLAAEGYIDGKSNLVAEHDAVTAHLGAPWRMPTGEDYSNLVENCTSTFIVTNSIGGWLLTGKGAYATKSIFFPCAGIGTKKTITNCWSTESNYGEGECISSTATEYKLPHISKTRIYRGSHSIRFTSLRFRYSITDHAWGNTTRPVRTDTVVPPADPVPLCTGASGVVRVDLRTGQVRVPAATETLTWSADWDGGKSVTLAANGTKIATGLKGSGTYTWTPNGLRGYTLTHTVIAGGAYVVHSAEFFVPVPLVEVSPTPLEGTAFTVWTNGVAVARTGGKYMVETNETVTVVYAVSNDDYVYADGPKSATFNASGAPGTPESVRPEAPTRIWFTKTSANFDIGYTLDGHGNAQYVVTHPEQVTLPIAYSTNNWDCVEGASKVSVLSQRHTPEGPVVTNVAETVENGEQGWQPDEGDFGRYNFGACAMTLDLASTSWLDASVIYTTNFNLSVVQPTAGGSVSACTNGVAAGESSWPLALLDEVSVEATPASVLWVLDSITTNGAPLAGSFVMPLDDVSVTAIFRYRGVDIPEAAPLAHTTRTLYTNDVESAALAVTVVSNTSAYVVYTADAGYYFADASTVQTNAVDTTTDPATFAALPPAPETSVPCTTWEQVKKMLEEGIPVKLMADIDPADETIVLTNSDVFIDLNGHEVRSTADPLFKVSDEATLTLTGDSGSLTGNVEVAEGGKFEMDGGTYEGEITVEEGGKFEMNGGTFEGELEADEEATVVVNGGVIGSDALDEYLAPGKERIDLGGGKSIIGQDVARDPDTGAITEGVFTFNPTNTEYAAIGVKLEDGLVAVYREDAAPTPGYVVGRPEDLAEHIHDELTWHPWTGSKALPTEEGAYYLVYDVVLTNEYAAADGVKLCLNGKTVKAAADRRVASVGAGVTFLMADCRGTGVLTGGVTDEPGAGVFVEGEFDFLGGSITGNVSSAGALATSNGTIVVGGTARVADNVGTNVYLFTGAKLSISGNSALREGADLRVLTEEKPQQMQPIAITMNGARTNLKFFHAEAAAEAVEYANGGLWLAVPTPILVTPTPVAHTTVSVYTNGVLSSEAGSGQWQAWSNQLATVVYTPADGYIFPDGTTAKTNLFDTAVDPATVLGDLPPEGAFFIDSQAALTSAIAALTNGCTETWYVGADFTVTDDNVIDLANASLTVIGNGHVLTAGTDSTSAFELVGTNGTLSVAFTDGLTLVDGRAAAVIATDPLVKTDGAVTVTGLAEQGLAPVSLLNGDGYGYVVGLTPSDVVHATYKVYAGGKEIAGPAPYLVPSNAAPVEVVYTPVDGYAFPDGTMAKTNAVDTAVDPATVLGDLPSAGAFVISDQTTLAAAIAALTNGCIETWYVGADFTVTDDNVIDLANASLTVIGNGHKLTAGTDSTSAFDLVGTNGTLSVAFTDGLTLVDGRAPAVIATHPLVKANGAVTVTGLTEQGLAPVSLRNGDGYGFVVGFTPTGVDNATCKVYLDGEELAGPAPYQVPSNAAPVEVVYTPAAGYVFPDGSAAKTNAVDTATDPAKVTGDLPAAPAVRIGSEEELEAAAAAVNGGTVGPTVTWCVTDDFTVSKKTALKRKGLNLTIFGNGRTITAEQVGTLADYVFDFTAVDSLEMSVEIDSLNLVVGDGFRNGLQVQWDESAGNKYRPMNATLTDVNITMARTAAPKKGGEVKLGAALVDNDGLVTLKGACAFTADQWTYSAIDITAKSFCDGNFDATVTIDSAAEVTFVDGRANTIAAVEPLVKLTDENAGERTAVAVGMERTALAEVSLANGDGWSYAVSLTLSDLDHATYKLYLGSEEIVGSSPYQLPSNAAPVTVVYTSADGYVFRHGAKVVTNAVDTTKNPATTPDVGSAKPIVVMIGDKGYASLEDAIAAANDGETVTIVSDQSIGDLLVMKNITLDLNGNTLTNAACTVNEGATATVTNSVNGAGGLVNAGAVTVSGTLDMSSLTWGAGGFIPGPNGTLAIARGGLVKMGSTDGKSPNWMLANKANFFNGSEDGARLTIGAMTYTKAGEFWSVDGAAATAEVETPGSLGQSEDLAYVESFDSLAAAVSSVKTNGTVTLVNDVAADEVVVAKDMTLDLDGWTFFAPTADAVALRLTAGSVVVTNGAVSNAVVKLDGTTGRFAIADTVTFVGTARVLMTDEFQAAVAERTASVTGFEAAIDLGDGTACGMPTLQEAMEAADEDSTLRIVNDLALASLAVKTNCVLDCNSHTCRVDGVLSATSGAALVLDSNSTVRMGSAFDVADGFTIGTAEDLLAIGIVKLMEPADGVTFTDEELEAFAAKVVPYDPGDQGFTTVVIDGAIWLAARFTVSYDAMDGKWADGSTVSNLYNFVTDGYLVPETAPTRANYEFAGWYASWTNGARQIMSGEPLEVFTDHKVYAKWLSKSVDPEHGEEILSGKDTDGGAAVIVTGAATNEQGAVVGAVENGTLAIPERIGNGVDGKFVKTLGRKAYAAEKYDDKVADDKKLRSVLFPTFMTRIGDEAFQNASRITNLTFAVTRDYKTGEKTTFDIGSRAFENTAVSTVVFPAGSKTKLRANSFANCTNLSEICVFGEIVGLDRGPFSGCGQKGGEVVLRLSPAYASDTAFVAMLTADLNATRVKISTEPLGQVMMKKIEVDVVTGDVTVTFAADLTSPWSVVNENSVSLFYTDDISKGFVGTGKVAYPNGPVTKDDSGDYKAVFTVPNPRSGQQFYRLTVGDERK